MICKALWAAGEIRQYINKLIIIIILLLLLLLLLCFNSVETELIRVSLGNPEKCVLFSLHPIFIH